VSETLATIDDRYEILELLDEGGTAKVYKARHRLMDKFVAIKVLKSALTQDEAMLARFKKEAQAATQLKHPAIVDVNGYGITPEGTPYLVMHFIDGTSLRSVLETEGRLKTDRAVRLFTQICAGLSVAHDHKMVHRDLKPGNIMIAKSEQDEQAIILDFGLVKAIGQEETQQALTRGAPIGTASYMSPEQCAGKEITPKSDIYSSACLLYEMLVGKPLFEGDSLLEIMYKQINDTPVLAELPSGLAQVISKALQKDPEKRYADIDEFSREVLACKGELVTSAQIAQGRCTAVPGRRRSTVRKTALIVAAGLLLSAVALILCLHKPDAAPPANLTERTIDEWMDKGLKIGDQERKPLKGPDYELAVSDFEMARKCAENGATYSRGNGSVYFHLGLCYMQLSRYGESVPCLERAIELSKSSSEDATDIRARSLQQLAIAYSKLGNIKQAEAALAKFVPIEEKAGKPLGVGWALSEYAKCLAFDMQMDKARPLFERAYTVVRKQEVDNHHDQSLMIDRDYVMSLIFNKQFKQAKDRISTMITRMDVEASPGQAREQLDSIAMYFRQVDMHEEAAHYLEMAYQKSKAAPEKGRTVAIGFKLSRWLNEDDKHADAEKIDAEIRPMRKELQSANDAGKNRP
jgi:serine/threonine protein kinase